MSFLESLVAAFKGASDRPPLTRGSVSPWFFNQCGAEGSRGRAPFDYNQAVRRAYLENPVAQRAVRLIAEGIGGAPLLPTDPALAALVTDTSAGQSLLETLGSHLLLHGNAWVQVMKDARGHPVELFALRPERVAVVAGEDGWPAAYSYEVAGQRLTIPLLDEDAAPNVIHIRHFHPGDDHYGAGCLCAADEAIATHNAASAWNRQLLENAARPSGALVYEGPEGAGLTGEQFDRLKAELTTAYAGMANAGRPMLLEGGLTWQAMAMTPADMDFATLKAAAARDIALAFGVPPMLLGLPGDATYNNYREANRALWRLTLLPLAAKIFAAIGEGLAPWFPTAALAIDLDRVPALAEDRERLWSQVNAADFLDPSEKRRILGLDEGNKS